MKVKSLLVLGAMLVSGVAQLFADGTAAPFSTQAPSDGANVYLYNVETGQYMVGTKVWFNWNTTTGFDSKGQLCTLELLEDGTYYIKRNDGKHNFRSAAAEMHVDMNAQGHDAWSFEQVGDYYRIRSAASDDTYGSEANANYDKEFWGWRGANDNPMNGVYPNLDPAVYGCNWIIVSEEDHDANASKIDLIHAFCVLKSKIALTKAEYPSVDFSSVEAVLNNDDSTIDELNAAIAKVEELVDVWKKSQIDWSAGSAASPLDITGLLTNPGFDNETYEGWAGTGYGKGGTTGPCAERYELVHDTYQKVTNVKPGVYVVKMDGFFRNGSTDNAFNTKGEKNYAYLYGANGVDTCKTSIMGLFDGINPEEPVEGVTFTYVSGGQTYYIPNSMKDACAFFDAGKYKDNTVYFGVTGDELTIGTFMKEKKTADWMLVDNFRLEYLGADADAYQVWNDKAMADVKTYEEGDASTPVIEAYAAAIEAAEKADTYDAVIANIKNVEAAEKAVEENIAAWKALNDEINLCKSTVNGLNGAEADVLKDYLDFDVEDMVNNKEASTEDILAEIQKLQEMLESAVQNNLEPGTDVTDLIKNANFKAGFANWTNSKGAAPVGTHGGLKAFPCVEVYSNVVDVQQTVTGLPKGVYRLSCQAFERPADNGKYTGEEPSKVFLFMNSAETPVQNIMKDGIPEDKAVDLENCFINGGTPSEDYYNTGGTTNKDYLTPNATYIPNGMSGASYAFRAGRYYQEAAGLVTDGKMTLGLTSKGQTAHWVLWADFKLTFLGNDATVVKPIVEEAINALKTDKPYGADVQKIVQDAVDAAQAAIEAEDGDAMVDALDALYAAKDPQDESIALFEKLTAKVEEFGDIINDSQADEAVKGEATAYWAGIDTAGMSNADAEEALAKLGLYENKLAIPAGYKDATPENPVEMTGLIQNADIDQGATVAWQYTKECQNGPALSGGMNGTPSIEFWNPDANGLKFNIWQEIAYLPAGTYMLKADISNSLNGQTDNGEAGRAVLYIMQGEETTESDPIDIQEEGCVDAWKTPSVTMALNEGKATVGVKNNGVMAARWIVIDNFQLFYLGEDAPTGIFNANVAGATTPVAFYDLSGARIAGPQKGINIIKLGNGKVQKVLVK